MINQEVLHGNQNQWKLIKLLGEGDAGQVYLVESLRENHQAILKRPHASSFSSDILRQSTQINTEASILKALAEINIGGEGYRVKCANLLDQSLPGNELTERYFIVIEKAPGIDLATLAKFMRFGFQENGVPQDILDHGARRYLQELVETGETPTLLLLKVIHALFVLLETIHKRRMQWIDAETHGILWNDIKPDHLFWDPAQAALTVIDWGNGQFLEEDGATKDRLFSPVDDYRQLIDEIGKYLSEIAPELFAELQWPASVAPDGASASGLQELRERIFLLLHDNNKNRLEARQREADLLSSSDLTISHLSELADTHRRLILFGDLPDYSASARLYSRMADALAVEGRMEEFKQVCDKLAQTPNGSVEKWETLSGLAEAGIRGEDTSRQLFHSVIKAGLVEDWPGALWALCEITKNDQDPDRWRTLSSLIRRMVSEINLGIPTPLVAASRLHHMLDDEHAQLRSGLETAHAAGKVNNLEAALALLSAYAGLIARLKNEVIRKWPLVDPVPPGADLTYNDLDFILSELEELLPRLGINPAERVGPVARIMSQPKAQIEILLDAWQAKGFNTARQCLQHLLLWDPDRRRVLAADQSIEDASIWLEDVRRGPHKGEKLQDYLIRMEFKGREIRSRVSTARWLENNLAIFAELRSDKRPGDLIREKPFLTADFPWLKRYERKLSHQSRPVNAAGSPDQPQKPDGASQAKTTQLGQGQDLVLAESLDTWVPEARGSSARVFLGFLRDGQSHLKQAAVKVMRPDKPDYALPLFWEEVKILTLMQGVPGVVKMIECGFIRLEAGMDLPSDFSSSTAHALAGSVIRLGPEEAGHFLDELNRKNEQGWLPYLALEKKNSEDNLLVLCDEGYTQGAYLPADLGMQMAVQICEILQSAHERDIVYRDHKILHYYWNQRNSRVAMIDWNVAKWYPKGLGENEKQLDLVQFGARALHHILTGRPALGALPLGPTRPDEIEMAPQTYTAAWTYDDKQRLHTELREILARVLSGGYDSAERLREDLLMQL